MGAEAQITPRQTGITNKTSAITAGKWVIAPRSCQSKYLGKPAAAKAAATEQEQPTPSTLTAKGKASVSATTPAPAKDSKGQADLLAQLMAQIKEQSAQIEALKASF